MIWKARITRDNSYWRYWSYNDMGGGCGSSAKTKDWAIMHVMGKNHVSEDCMPVEIEINGTIYSPNEIKQLVKNGYVLANI